MPLEEIMRALLISFLSLFFGVQLTYASTEILECEATYKDSNTQINVPDNWQQEGSLKISFVHHPTDQTANPILHVDFLQQHSGLKFHRFFDSSDAQLNTHCTNGPGTCGSIYSGTEDFWPHPNGIDTRIENVYFKVSTSSATGSGQGFLKLSKGLLFGDGIRAFYELSCSMK